MAKISEKCYFHDILGGSGKTLPFWQKKSKYIQFFYDFFLLDLIACLNKQLITICLDFWRSVNNLLKMKAVEDFISLRQGPKDFSKARKAWSSRPNQNIDFWEEYIFLPALSLTTVFPVTAAVTHKKNQFVRTCVNFRLQFTAALCAVSLAYYAVGQTSCPYFRTAQLFRIWWHHPLTKNQPTAILLFQMRNSACWTSANSSVKLVRSVVLLSRARAPLQWPSNLSLQQQQQSWPAAAKQQQQQLHCSAAPVVRCSSSSSGAGLGTDPHVMKHGQRSGAMRTWPARLPDKESTPLRKLELPPSLLRLLLLMDIGLTLDLERCASCCAATFNAAA